MPTQTRSGGGGSSNPFASGGTTANVLPKSNGASALQDSPLLAPDANTVRQANTTTSQTFELYSTTDSNSTPVNYERARLFYNSGGVVWTLNFEKGGTGTARALDIASGGNYSFLNGIGGSRSFIITPGGLVNTYGQIATTGQGLIAARASARSVAQTAAVGSVATYTPNADSSFEVSANVLVTTATTHSFTVTCAYTDEGNTARTLTLPFVNVAGSAIVNTIANAAGTVPYMGMPVQIRAKASTAITIATTGTFTIVTYNVEGIIKQVN